ncbi:hypothetical protein BEI_2552 [Halomonas beimenensis]|uniref:Uncharacterized protein n=1 Tax=Halomonas beimenensis TaxID=475662 RepID=A0A291P9J4_9GAMM|nr:hypothetical protein BEI_2552 [Halomonas beimenensis]
MPPGLARGVDERRRFSGRASCPGAVGGRRPSRQPKRRREQQ